MQTQHESGQKSFLIDTIKNTVDQAISENMLTPLIESFDYEMMGSIGFLHGVEFSNQRIDANLEVIRNIYKRLITEHNITHYQLNQFYKMIMETPTSTIESKRNKLREENPILKSVVDMFENKTNFAVIVSTLRDIMSKLILPVKMSEDIHRIEKKLNAGPIAKELNYHDVLVFINILYNDSLFDGKVIQLIINLQSNPDWTKITQKATKYFDLQKFNIVYLDSILTIKELLTTSPEISTWLDHIDDDAKLLDLFKVEVKETESETEIEEPNNSEKYVPVEVDMRDTDVFLKELFQNTNGTYIKTAQDILDINYKICSTHDLIDMMQDVYKYLKTQKNSNRKPWEEIYVGIDKSEFMELIDSKIKDIGLEYKTDMEKFLQDIPEDKLTQIVFKINELIKLLIIENDEVKPYLIQQIASNQIKTVKQLFQTIELIENCLGKSATHRAYVQLAELLKSYEYDTLFAITQGFEGMEVKLNYLTSLKQFYSVDLTEQSKSDQK